MTLELQWFLGDLWCCPLSSGLMWSFLTLLITKTPFPTLGCGGQPEDLSGSPTLGDLLAGSPPRLWGRTFGSPAPAPLLLVLISPTWLRGHVNRL